VLFDEKWHQLRLLVTEEDVTLYVDDLEVETMPLEPPVGIFINGKTQVGKYVNKETTVPFEIQKLRIYCDPEQNNRETACEIPGICSNSPEATPEPCACPPGPPGLPGLKKQAALDVLVIQDQLVLMETLGYQVHQEKRAPWDSREDQGYQDKMEKRALMGSLDHLGHQDIQESRESPAPTASPVWTVEGDTLECLACLESQA
ncbi:hypothetical protein CRUP_016458, partial [Coryphaenoides rupestris]